MNTTHLNPMVFYERFQHISEKIFEKLNIKDLENSREVSKAWMQCIDNQNILWNKIAENEDGNKVFQKAYKKGHFKLAKVLIEKSVEYQIDLNKKAISA